MTPSHHSHSRSHRFAMVVRICVCACTDSMDTFSMARWRYVHKCCGCRCCHYRFHMRDFRLETSPSPSNGQILKYTAWSRMTKVLKCVRKAFSKSTCTNHFVWIVSFKILQRSYKQMPNLTFENWFGPWMNKRFLKLLFFIFTYRIRGTPNNKCEKSTMEPIVLCFTTGWTNVYSLLQRRTFGKLICRHSTSFIFTVISSTNDDDNSSICITFHLLCSTFGWHSN